MSPGSHSGAQARTRYGSSGTIRPDRWSAGLTIALALAFVVVSVLSVASALRTALPWGAALAGRDVARAASRD